MFAALSRTLLVATLMLLAVATPSQAFTATPLGRCVEPTGAPVLESLAVSNPTSVTADGMPRGQVGITLRTKSIAYQGGPIQLFFDAIDAGTGRVATGSMHMVLDGGCKRYTFKMSELQFKLKRQRLYLVRVSAGYTDQVYTPTFPSLEGLFAPSAFVWVQ